MSLTIGLKGAALVVILLYVGEPAIAQGSSQAQDPPKILCPSGYSKFEEICIDDKTGDIVLPIDQTSQTNSK